MLVSVLLICLFAATVRTVNVKFIEITCLRNPTDAVVLNQPSLHSDLP